MRTMSFITGGIIGAAIVMYSTRNNNTMMQTLSNAGKFVNKLMDPNVTDQIVNIFQDNNEDLASTYQMQ